VNTLKRHIITILFLLLAIACYVLGVPAGGILFFLLGIVFDGVFWIRLFRHGKAKA